MVDGIKLENGDVGYVVKFDLDGNGHADDVIFTDPVDAGNYEDCYVDNNRMACKKLFEGETGFPIADRIQFFTSSGLKGKDCDLVAAPTPLFELKTALKRLADNFKDLGSATLLEMGRDLFAVVTSDPGAVRLKGMAVKYLSELNSIGGGKKLTDAQIDLLAQLAVNHRSDLKDILKSSVDVFSGDAKRSIFKAAMAAFGTCIEDEQNTCANDAVTLTENELLDVSKEFGNFTDCKKVNGRELAEERIIMGVPCAAGSYVEFHDNGKLAFAMLAEDHKISDFTFKKGTVLTFNEDGTLESASLSTNHILGGYNVSAREKVLFERNNSLSWFRLSKDQVINNVGLKAGMFVGLTGKSEEPMIVQFVGPREVNGMLAKDTNIHLGNYEIYQDGVLMNPYEPHWGRYFLPTKSFVTFYPDGKLRSLGLAEGKMISGIDIPGDSEVEFYPDGDLKTVLLSDKTTVAGVELQKNDIVLFSPDGDTIRVYLSSDRVINSLRYKKGAEVTLPKNEEEVLRRRPNPWGAQ